MQSAKCSDGRRWRCAAGGKLKVTGHDLESVTSVAFVGGRGGRDDRIARPRSLRPRSFVVRVPRDARTGTLRVRNSSNVARTDRRVRITSRRLAGTSAPAGTDMIFPIAGRHDMGQSETNSFGGGRGHQGHDMFADCGTRLVAITSGEVQAKGYHSAAGHYVVIKGRSGESYAYMHLRSASHLSTGDSVSAGDSVGRVGDTGRATGCHLHFEQWTSPGWYTGGRAVDPMPLLRELEAAPHSH
ncbi:MAG TPA: M23 family metallopeptidase [Cryptosporangiaceae bacterium]|nr:M23 family metallopeptidase [Cryptosporangiaceae bacterium]